MPGVIRSTSTSSLPRIRLHQLPGATAWPHLLLGHPLGNTIFQRRCNCPCGYPVRHRTVRRQHTGKQAELSQLRRGSHCAHATICRTGDPIPSAALTTSVRKSHTYVANYRAVQLIGTIIAGGKLTGRCAGVCTHTCAHTVTPHLPEQTRWSQNIVLLGGSQEMSH